MQPKKPEKHGENRASRLLKPYLILLSACENHARNSGSPRPDA